MVQRKYNMNLIVAHTGENDLLSQLVVAKVTARAELFGIGHIKPQNTEAETMRRP